jgi:DNA-binding NarL/FixJ family response regulator
MMAGMPPARTVALLSDDLMFRSQLAAAVEGVGGALVAVRVGEPVPAADAVFVDLNGDTPHRLGFIATLRAERPQQSIVAFCHHGEKELREMAMRVGASSCVTNGALQAVALRLAGIAAPSGERT